MMDRNLGATSAAPGDVRALGLLYQWGRKDPFLGSTDWDINCQYPDYYETFRWESTKTIYDPCPQGWKVPTGDDSGFWSTAFGWHVAWVTASNWDSKHKGMNFGSTDRTLGTGTIWYPATGQIDSETGDLDIHNNGWHVGEAGMYWSCSSYKYQSYSFIIDDNGYIVPNRPNEWRADGRAVRCVRD